MENTLFMSTIKVINGQLVATCNLKDKICTSLSDCVRQTKALGHPGTEICISEGTTAAYVATSTGIIAGDSRSLDRFASAGAANSSRLRASWTQPKLSMVA